MSDGSPHVPLARRPQLALVEQRAVLARLHHPVPQAWSEAIDRLLGWLALDRGVFAEADGDSDKLPLGPQVPVFAPWQGWAPTAWQNGGDADLPEAIWAASYLLDHGPGLATAARAVDVVLMSPLPAQCRRAQEQDVGLPDPAVMAAMSRAARAEGRERIAMIIHAGQRRALAQLIAAIDGEVDAATLSILTIEEALPTLIQRTSAWEAIIAMPDLRGVVFTLLAEASGVRGAWPMLWRGAVPGSPLVMITSEMPGEGLVDIALDAPALVQGLALALHHGGWGHAARRLNDGWTRLRDSGVTTPGRGTSAPYVNTLADGEFIATLAKGMASGQRAVPTWRAFNRAENAKVGSLSPLLRVVPSNVFVSGR